MRGTLIAAVAAPLAVLTFAAAKPALSAPAPAALSYGEHQAGMVQEVGRKYRYSRKWYRNRPYYSYGYGYGYRPYRYYGYGGPYSYYGYGGYGGYPYYYRRPGVSLWFGF